MKDFLTDIVNHTHALGCINLVKIIGEDDSTKLESLDAQDKTVVIKAEFHKPNADFKGLFGLPNLSKLNVILNIPEYKENSKINVVHDQKNGENIPSGLRFENEKKDFVNEYRFMSKELVNATLKDVKFKGANWNVTFQPTVAAIQRFKFQAQANSEETSFVAKTENGDLKFYFGDHSTHAGNFVFQSNIGGTLSKSWSWPVQTFINILGLDGDKVVQISDDGVAMITVDSGLIKYEYILPALTK